MPAPLIAAGIMAGGALASSMASNSGTRRAQLASNKFNLKMWHLQNAYNNPQSQMSRLRQAGLNPNMIYGASPASATGNAQSVAPSKAAPYKIDNPFQNITQYSDIKQKEATTNNLKELGTVIQQDKLLRQKQGIGQGIANKFAPALARTSLQVQSAQVNQMQQQTIGTDIDNQIKNNQKANLMKDISFRVQNAQSTLKGTNLSNELKALERDLKLIGIEKTDPWYFRIMGRALSNPAKTSKQLNKIKNFKQKP